MTDGRAGLYLMCLVLATVPATASGEAAGGGAPPAGLRCYYTGHSFHAYVAPMLESLALAAGIAGHETAGWQNLGGSSVLQHWELSALRERDQVEGNQMAKTALEAGKVDVLTMSPHPKRLPDAGIPLFTLLGLAHNPNLRIVVQASWLPGDATPPYSRDTWIEDNALRDTVRVEDLRAHVDWFRGGLEAQVDSLNGEIGRRALTIVPMGDAVLALRALVAEGRFPGVSKQSGLFRDPVGHGLGPVRALTAYCNFSVVYGVSPVGLNLDTPDVTDEQHRILQELAWETVSSYPHAGLGDPATEHPSQTGK